MIGALMVYAGAHLWAFGTSPGLHYDEAWAANFSLRIAETPGFWPVEAMSPQTHAWHHYVVAAIFRLLGPSVETFRFTHFAFGLSGVLLLGAALARELRRASLLPTFVLLAGIQPALAANHRFAIELTSFHTLCFGSMLYFGLSSKASHRYVAAILASLGVGSHIFFMAPASALVIAVLLDRDSPKPEARHAIFLGLLLTLPYVLKLQFSLPERDKAAALLAGIVLLALATWKLPGSTFWKSVRPQLRKITLALSLLVLPLAAFLLDGNWSALAHTGRLRFPILAGTGIIPVVLTGSLLFDTSLQSSHEKRLARLFLFWSILSITTVLIAPKPTGRYFETLLLTSTALSAVAWTVASSKARWLFLTWPAVLVLNLLVPATEGRFEDRPYRFLFFHDQPSDFLPKQHALTPLARMGCAANQIEGVEGRDAESVRFILSRGRLDSACSGQRFRAVREFDGLRIESLAPSAELK